jgi:glycosyltransferase involved in cell wall biosynthesis
MKLGIISPTPHYLNSKGQYVGWGPTLIEIEYLTELFDEIVHVAPLYPGAPPNACIPYQSDKITFYPLVAAGGPGIKNKLKIISSIYTNLRIIREKMKGADWIHLRTPANLGLYTLPYLSLTKNKNVWVKYAGNWKQENAPWSYALQRWWLRHNLQHSKVTINGKWPGSGEHLLSFENPCLTEDDLKKGRQLAALKDFNGQPSICFVGTLETNKGAGFFLQSLKNLSQPFFKKVYIVGDGSQKEYFQELAKEVPLEVVFTGFLRKEQISEIYGECQFSILPSASEGFPKVIAEAANYGCIPIVTDMSCLSQYIFSGENGFLLKDNKPETITSLLEDIFSRSWDFRAISGGALKMAELFTFHHFLEKVKSEILCV